VVDTCPLARQKGARTFDARIAPGQSSSTTSSAGIGSSAARSSGIDSSDVVKHFESGFEWLLRRSRLAGRPVTERPPIVSSAARCSESRRRRFIGIDDREDP
jgi:hypothetical protein